MEQANTSHTTRQTKNMPIPSPICVLILLTLLFTCLTPNAKAQNVNAVGEKVLKTMEEMSASWKKVKDHKSAMAQSKKTQELAKRLTSLAAELQKYPRPDNATRTKIKNARAKRIEKFSMEIAETFTMLNANAPLMSAFAAELQKIKKPMDSANKVFDLYFEPDPIAGKEKGNGTKPAPKP